MCCASLNLLEKVLYQVFLRFVYQPWICCHITYFVDKIFPLSFFFQMLMDLGVERLILPVVPSSLRKWNTSFGYSNMKYSDRLQLLDYRFMDFQDSIMCQKPLLRIPLAEPQPSTGIFDAGQFFSQKDRKQSIKLP